MSFSQPRSDSPGPPRDSSSGDRDRNRDNFRSRSRDRDQRGQHPGNGSRPNSGRRYDSRDRGRDDRDRRRSSSPYNSSGKGNGNKYRDRDRSRDRNNVRFRDRSRDKSKDRNQAFQPVCEICQRKGHFWQSCNYKQQVHMVEQKYAQQYPKAPFSRPSLRKGSASSPTSGPTVPSSTWPRPGTPKPEHMDRLNAFLEAYYEPATELGGAYDSTNE